MTTPVDTEGLTRDQRRSLMLGRAVAEKLRQDPERVLDMARSNLASMQVLHTRGQAKHWLAEWYVLLEGPVGGVVDALTSPAPHARELRQNSPFAGVLTQHERLAVLASFRAEEAANLSLA
jgi:hypothetical protein